MADLTIEQPDDFGLASVVTTGPGAHAALAKALRCAIAPGAVASHGDAIALWGTAPDQWLAHADFAAPDWADVLGERLAGVATVVDQSSAYVLFHLAGADAQRLLQKGLPVDLAALTPGAVVVSAIAHIGVIVHCAAPDSYHLAVFRSFADSFREWLNATIAAL